MEFFDKLTKKASEAYKITADKTGKLAKETKLKLKISELKSEINEIYEEIGKKAYEKHTRKANGEKCAKDLCKEIEEKCLKIDVLSDEIENLLKQCLELNDKKQCQKCFTEMDKKAKFCPHCGEKQEEIVLEPEVVDEEKEPEVVEDENIESAETSEVEENKETIENKDTASEEIENEKSNLEKTVEIESNVETSEDVSEVEEAKKDVEE